MNVKASGFKSIRFSIQVEVMKKFNILEVAELVSHLLVVLLVVLLFVMLLWWVFE